MTVIPGKNYPGQKGFPTPNTAPETSACRTFSIPASDDWLGLIMGAVSLLANPDNYYRWGSLTQQEAADAWLAIIDGAYAQALTGQCAPNVPTPFWDSATDVDLEMSADAQIWYGKAGSFVEDIAIWSFAGLIVASLGIAGIAPALAYVTISQRFVLEYKNDNLGAVIHFFLDGIEVFRGNDVGDHSISHVTLIGDPALETHDVLITADEGDGLSVVRKELDPAEVYPTNERYNADCDCIQVTNDNGATWHDAPQSDPRHADYGRLPAITGADPKCHAASNMSRFISDVIAEALTVMAESSDGIAVATFLLPYFLELGPFGILFDVIIAVALLLLSAGVTALSAAFTSSVYDTLTCILDCNIGDDGQVSAAQLASINTDIDAQIGGLAATVLHAVLGLMGEVNLSNAGVKDRGEPVDCSGCECTWTYRWDFGVNNGGWVANALDGTGWGSGYVAGCCWVGTSNAIAYHLPVGVHVVKLGANASSPVAFAQASTNNSGTFIHRCDGGACDVIDWTFTTGQWVYCFQFVEQIYWVDMHGTGSRPALTGGSFI